MYDMRPGLLEDILFNADCRLLFEHTPNILFFIKDNRGRLIYCNTNHRHSLFRFVEPSVLYGKNNDDFFPSDLASSFAEDDRWVIENGKPLVDRVELNRSHSGSLGWYCTTKVPARNQGNQVVGLVGVSRRLEEAKRQLGEFNLMMPALEFLQDSFRGDVQIGALARSCQMTDSTFYREFKKRFRMTPMKFVIRLRIHDACLQLAQGINPIGDVANRCGFSDQNYFARQFKRMMGISPTEFRARYHRNN